MTTKILTGYYSGYALTSPVTVLSIAASGYVGGSGINVAHDDGNYTIINDHVIKNIETGSDTSNDAISGYLFFSGANIINGSSTDTLALIEGTDRGIEIAGGAIENFGRIIGHSTTEAAIYEGNANITNGSASDPNALIEGGQGIEMTFGVVTNLGLILATGTTVTYGSHAARPNSGVYVANYGTVINGSATNKTSLIQGYDGVEFSNNYSETFSTLTNFGTIQSTASPSAPAIGGRGVEMHGSGVVTNGAASDQTALIQGRTGGVVVYNHNPTVANFGTIQGVDTSVVLYLGGTVTNGSSGDLNALITGSVGVYADVGVLTISNFGTITGGAGAGVLATYGATVTNGSATDTQALIKGVNGVTISRHAGKVTNFGLIDGFGVYSSTGINLQNGGAITNGSSSDTSAEIYGYGAAIVVAGGAGTLVNDGEIVGAIGYAVEFDDGGRLTNGSTSLTTALILSGGGILMADAAGTVSNFGTIEGEAQDSWGVTLQTSGSRLTNGAAGDATALIKGYGGVLVAAGATVTNFAIINGAIAVNLQASTSVLLAEAGSKVEGEVSSSGRVDVVGGVASITGGLVNSGAVLGAGTLALTGGTSQFNAGSALSVAKIAVSGAATVVDFDAGIADGKVWTQTAGMIEIGAGDKATFSGTGNSFSGVSITGAGSLAFTAGTDALIGDSLSLGAVTFGAAKVTISGVTTISAPVSNTGTLTLASGTLTVSGAVTGTGTIAIGSGVADFTSTFSENVTFTGATGVLELGKSQTYAGTVTGFSKTGTNSLDLGDIAFGAGTKASYSGTATSGTLTVTDGTHTAKIKLSGNYTTSAFTVSSDGHGGTKVVDPTAGARGVSPLAFIGAAASFGAGAAPLAQAPVPWRGSEPLLAVGRGQIA